MPPPIEIGGIPVNPAQVAAQLDGRIRKHNEVPCVLNIRKNFSEIYLVFIILLSNFFK